MSFDLDKAMAAWRRALRYRRAFSREDLDELEAHLRDHIETLVADGHSEEEAYRTALYRLGDAVSVEDEYRKVFWLKLRHQRALLRELIWEVGMLRNFVKMAFRTMRRRVGYTCINVVGLAAGLACCLLILLFIHDEWQHDRFHEKANRIHRIVTATYGEGKDPDEHGPLSSRLVADHLRQEIPEVEQVVRLQPWDPQLVHEGHYYDEDDFLYADASFFDVFSFTLLQGNPATVLQDPFMLVLTESMQRKYFGDASALGQTVVLNDSLTFTVTGIAADPPSTSHFAFDALVSHATLESLRPPRPYDWINFGSNYTYVLLHGGASPAAVGAKIADLPMREFGSVLKQVGIVSTLALQSLTRIYLHSSPRFEIGRVGNVAYLYTFGAIALFVLLIACINFMNLSTARSVERAREVGIRKLVGSQRGTLVLQFMSESIVTVLIALVLAGVLVALALPYFNEVANKELALSTVLAPSSLLVGVGFALIVGLLAGSYPALVLSRFKPAAVLKGAFKTSRHGIRLRQGLVVFQFAITIVLFVSTLVVVKQLRYMQNQRLGFDKEQVLVLAVPPGEQPQRYQTFADAFRALSNVQSVTSANHVPGQRIGNGVVFPGDQPSKDSRGVAILATDYDYLETMGIEMVAGRPFSKDIATDAQDAALINEAALATLGYASPEAALGEVVVEASDMRLLTIVGVIQDYHHVSLQERIGPMLLRITPSWHRYQSYLALRLSTDAITDTMQEVEATWDQLFPGHAFDFFFLDDAFDQQYTDERRLTQIFATFAALAILIACLGLFGLASFMTAQRTKEIGVRKVLGASVTSIVVLLTRGIAGLVLLAFGLAVPIAYLAMNRWLEDFAYRIDLSWWVFLIAGSLALVVALLTVGYQSVKAALADPVKSLRYE